MSTSIMASRIAMYQREPALFNTDIQNQVNKWESRYIIPLSNAYETAKNQLNEAIKEAQRIAEARAKAMAELQAKVSMVIGIAFSILGPYASAAYTAARPGMASAINGALDDRLLTKAIAAGRVDDAALNAMVTRSRIRTLIVNDILENRLPQVPGMIKDGMTAPGTGSSGTATPTGAAGTNTPTMPGVSAEMMSGAFSAERVNRTVKQVFLNLAIEMHDRHMSLLAASGDRTKFLQESVKTVLARPPVKAIDEWIGGTILSNQMFGILAANYLLSFTPDKGRGWPQIPRDLAFTINKALQASGFSIINNNPQMGVKEELSYFGQQYWWDGNIMEPQKRKIIEIAKGGAAVLEAYMQAFGMAPEAA